MPAATVDSFLQAALMHAPSLVWSDHQNEAIARPTPSEPYRLDTTQTPALFQKLKNLTNIAGRIESVLLQSACDPTRFVRTLGRLVGPAFDLIKHPDLNLGQRVRLRSLLPTALAIAYQQGLTREIRVIQCFINLAIEHQIALWEDNHWLLLSGLEVALQDHAETQAEPLETVRQARKTLEEFDNMTGLISRDPRTMGQPSVQEKCQCLKALVNQPPCAGPHTVAQWAWAAANWTEPELRLCLLDGVTQLLTEAAKGVLEDRPFRGAFLFDRFPEDLLRDAFYCVGAPDNARLLQVRPLTERSRTLLNHYLQNQDIPEAHRQRLRDWHRIA